MLLMEISPMATLLHLDTSPLATSVSRELTSEFVSNWKIAHPAGRVIHRDLAANPPKPVDQAWIYAAHTPLEARTPEQKALLAYSEECIGELQAADEYVLGVAMHNFSIPSVLKLWIDQISRVNKTFSYATGSPVGLLTGKKATILIATGGIYDAGTAMASYNFVEPYLRTVLGFLGVTDVTVIAAGGAAGIMYGKIDRASFLAPHVESIRSQFQAA
jgi:FMN-dependent NADH-azoreductase